MATPADARRIFIDPVCLKAVPQGKFHRMFTYRFRSYYFCTETCREAFMADPEKYVNPETKHLKGIKNKKKIEELGDLELRLDRKISAFQNTR